MLNLLDKKGRPLGRPYDYEYYGRKREKRRAGQINRSKIMGGLMALPLFGLGLWLALKEPAANTKNNPEDLRYAVLGLWAFGVGILWFGHYSRKKYRQLCEALKPAHLRQLGQ